MDIPHSGSSERAITTTKVFPLGRKNGMNREKKSICNNFLLSLGVCAPYFNGLIFAASGQHRVISRKGERPNLSSVAAKAVFFLQSGHVPYFHCVICAGSGKQAVVG